MVRALCAADDCSQALPKGRRKWCSNACRDRMNKRRQRARARQADGREPRRDVKPLEKANNLVYLDRSQSRDGRGGARRGPKYEEFVATGLAEEIALGHMTASEAADELGERPGSVSRWMAAYVEDKAAGALQSQWTMDEAVAEALDDFGKFCARYWPDDVLPGFQMEWADLISETITTGGRLLLLAPQRHGKSMLMRKYCVWRICRDPNIRIIWVSQSAKVAERTGSWVLDTLTQYTRLIEDVLGPGQTFRPPTRQNMPWTAEKFTVGSRTKVQAANTMTILGKTGSILSLDADLLVVDDYQEYKHIRSPSIREEDEVRFFTDLVSRKLPQTGLVVIGSRQHVDDIYSKILKRGDHWTVRTYQVHDPTCTEDPDNPEAHDGVPPGKVHVPPKDGHCMLWPWQYPYWYMQEQRDDQGEAYFQRNMMNDPKADQLVYVTSEDIARRMDPSYLAGEVPKGARLIGGIDPASAKPTAGSVWAYRKGKRYLVDAVLASPGNKGVREILEMFNSNYGCFRFLVEQNGYQGEIMQDSEVKAMISGLGLHVAGHYTSRVNKWNEASGVVKMLHSIRSEDSPVVLPSTGDKEILDRLEKVYRQWVIFDPDFAGHKHADDDLTMATWFPQLQMDRWDQAESIAVVVDYDDTGYAASTYGTLTGGWR